VTDLAISLGFEANGTCLRPVNQEQTLY